MDQPTDSESYGINQDDRPDIIPFDLDYDVPTEKPLTDHGTDSKLDATSELMRYHTRLGHLPFATLKLMAARKEIPA